MTPDDSLQASFWLMIFLQTLGAVDMPGSGNRKMPAPRQYVPVIITWSVLQLVSDTGANGARAANAAGWVMVLAGAVLGPFGAKATNFLSSVAKQFGAQAVSGTTSTAPAAASTTTVTE
jgi:hypothetical protein